MLYKYYCKFNRIILKSRREYNNANFKQKFCNFHIVVILFPFPLKGPLGNGFKTTEIVNVIIIKI